MAPTAAATHEQIEALLDFMDENHELARGLLRGAGGRVRSKQLWENLCNSHNSMGSCTKSVEQWQTEWSDKNILPKKLLELPEGQQVLQVEAVIIVIIMGGAPTLSQVELKILSIMGEGFGKPETRARVPAFPLFPPVREPVATIPTDAATSADPLSQEQASTSTEAQEPAAVPHSKWSCIGNP